MGEHGDSEFAPWSQALLATKPILELCGENDAVCRERLVQIEEEVRTAAYKIIEAKNATYYGIGMALTRITKAILGDEHSVLTVSAMMRGDFGQRDVFVGAPLHHQPERHPEGITPVPDRRGDGENEQVLRYAAGKLRGDFLAEKSSGQELFFYGRSAAEAYASFTGMMRNP